MVSWHVVSAFARLVLFCTLGGTVCANAQLFREVRPADVGIRWSRTSGHSEKRYLPETIPPGVAIFDYDNDGWMDILIVNAGESSFYHPQQRLAHGLFHNNHDGTFTDVTESSGITANLFAMGIAVGDYDGDGFPDVFISGYGRSVLYHNDGHGKFTDVTVQSAVNPPGWSTSAVWFDYNNDGKLDLFVAQFVDYSSLLSCTSTNAYGGKVAHVDTAQSFYCIPRIFPAMPSHLYRNDGNGHFTDVSQETGIAKVPGKGFGVVATDVNNDGFLDLFQANDTMPNFLFMNRAAKGFEESGLESEVGYSDTGIARSGMGVDSGDVDGDGWQDLFVANVDQETFSLYRNDHDGTFSNISQRSGIAERTRLLSGWGLKFFDFDNDGLQDLILANGHPDDLVDLRMRGVTYKEPLLLFHNIGNGKMVDVSANAGPAFQRQYSARGLAVGDLNNDGFPDVVVGVVEGPPLLLYNTSAAKNHWLGLRLVGKIANHDAIGAIIKWSVNGKVRSRLKTGGGSFLSSSDPREILGLGDAARIDWLEVHWPAPSTQVDRITNPALNRYLRVVEGESISSNATRH